MNCYKFEFLMLVVIMNGLEGSQQKINSGDKQNSTDNFELCTHNPPNIKATACKTDSRTQLKFYPADIFEVKSPDSEVCKNFLRNDSVFLSDDTNNPFCNDYFLLDNEDLVVFLKNKTLANVEIKCPNEEPICLWEKCPIKNFNVVAESRTDQKDNLYIVLRISWDKIDTSANIQIRISSANTENDCLGSYFHDTLNHSLMNNTIVRPDTGVWKQAIEPGCIYIVTIQSNGIYCDYNYTVPECVGIKCDCTKYKPDVHIQKIENLKDNSYRIKWELSQNKIFNKKQEIINASFKYFEKINTTFHVNEQIPQNQKYLGHHRTHLEMLLSPKKKYLVMGKFRNNFLCDSEVAYTYSPSASPDMKTPLLIAICFIFSCCVIIRFVKKSKKCNLDLVLCKRTNSGPCPELAPLEEMPVSITVNNNQYALYEYQNEEIFNGFEIPRYNIAIKEIIGSGAFGKVYSAKLLGATTKFKMVAVKTLGDGEHVSRDAVNDFIAEIQIFEKIGEHPNIISLLGYCTKEEPYWMIMEFAPCGDLKNYLLELRKQWLRRNSQVFFPDDGAYIDATLSTISTSLPSAPSTSATFADNLLTPRLADYSIERVLDHTELQQFAFQIAKGMAHLEKIPITHRDLAARNILINEYRVLKISDFGLSRMGPYVNTKAKKLPLRWMGLESILEHKYDSKSDIWSFGVVLWEIGTLGAFPYEKVCDSLIQQFLQVGRRLERPEICTDELYSIMTQCWEADPAHRPTFAELVEALDVKTRKVYVNFNQLNPTYVFPPSELNVLVEQPVVKIVEV